MARPKTRLDLDEVEKLGALHCTDEELASFFGVSARTIARRRQSSKFREALERGKARWKLAQSGQLAAAIFLSKNVLGYRDAGSMEVSGPGGGPIEIASKPDFSNLNADELKQLRTLAAKTKAR
jgi:hypothetical protein